MLCSLVAQPYKQALAAKARVPGVWTRQSLGSLEERFRCNIVLLYSQSAQEPQHYIHGPDLPVGAFYIGDYYQSHDYEVPIIKNAGLIGTPGAMLYRTEAVSSIHIYYRTSISLHGGRGYQISWQTATNTNPPAFAPLRHLTVRHALLHALPLSSL